MKHSSCFFLSKFLQRWALHLPQALCLHLLETLCYSSSWALLSFGDGVSRKWGEGGRRAEVGRRGGVGRRGNFWGREGGWKIPGQGKRMCFRFIPKTAWTASSWTGALVAVVSLQLLLLRIPSDNNTMYLQLPVRVCCWRRFLLQQRELASLGCSPVFSFAFCALLFATWTPTCNPFRLPESACPRAATPSSLRRQSGLSFDRSIQAWVVLLACSLPRSLAPSLLLCNFHNRHGYTCCWRCDPAGLDGSCTHSCWTSCCATILRWAC